MRKRNLIMVAGACLAAVTMIAPSALADPTGPSAPPHRPLNGLGSSVTQDVMNALSNLIRVPSPAGPKVISSWDKSGDPDPFRTGDNPACQYTRMESSDGVARLRESLGVGDPRNGCLQSPVRRPAASPPSRTSGRRSPCFRSVPTWSAS